MLTALALALPLPLAAGCGGGSSASSSTTAATTTKPATQAQSSTGATAPKPAATAQGKATAPATGSAGASSTVASANAICKRRNRELAAISEPEASDSKALAAAARRQATIEQRALGELEKLVPPAAIASPYRQILASNKATLLAIVSVGEAAVSGSAAKVRTAQSHERSGQLRLLGVALRTGLGRCAGVPLRHRGPAGLSIP